MTLLLLLALPLLSPLQASTTIGRAHDEPARVASSTESEVEIFDIRDLVSVGWMDLSTSTSEAAQRRARQERLAELVRNKMPADARGELDDIDSSIPGVLSIRGGASALEFARRFLALQREATGLYSVYFTFIEVPQGMFDSLHDELDMPGSSRLFEDAKDGQALVDRLRKDERVEVISSPSIVFGPRDMASVSVTNQVAYVADYKLTIVEPGHAEILDPIIKVAEEGNETHVSGVPVPSGGIDFEVEISYSKLQRPIPTKQMHIGAGQGREVEVSLPEVSKMSITALLNMQPGSAALMVSPALEEQRFFVALMTFEGTHHFESGPVDALFASMRDGSYSHRWFPPVGWSDLDALIGRSSSREQLDVFPMSPLTKLRPPVAIEGAVALWLIEGLRQEGHCPSLLPLLVEDGAELDASPKTQRRLLERARQAYLRWSKALPPGAPRESTGPSPLDGSGLGWY